MTAFCGVIKNYASCIHGSIHIFIKNPFSPVVYFLVFVRWRHNKTCISLVGIVGRVDVDIDFIARSFYLGIKN